MLIFFFQIDKFYFDFWSKFSRDEVLHLEKIMENNGTSFFLYLWPKNEWKFFEMSLAQVSLEALSIHVFFYLSRKYLN